ncbi:MAG TPA: DUF167 family protein [Bryobacteraceae bacterium]|nr:DUF167 family protein [Bryobacteraceae bacterium]
MKVLLADDDEDQLHLRALVLEKSGFETIEAGDSASAMRAAAAQKPQCAVVDLRLPTQALGLALIRDLKSLDAAMRIIVLTGSDPNRFDGLPEKKLVDEVILKGASSAQLVAKLRDMAGQPLLDRLRQNGSVTLDVKVIPRSSKSEVNEVMADGALKVKLCAVPEKGHANEALNGVLAEYFGVPKSHVELLSGETSRRKRVRITKGR